MSLNIVERHIVEELIHQSLKTDDLCNKLSLKREIIDYACHKLQKENWLLFDIQDGQTKWSLNMDKINELKEFFEHDVERYVHSKAILMSALKLKLIKKKDNQIKIKKIRLSKRDEKIYKSKVLDIQKFLDSCDTQNLNDSTQATYFFIGDITSQEVLLESLKTPLY